MVATCAGQVARSAPGRPVASEPAAHGVDTGAMRAKIDKQCNDDPDPTQTGQADPRDVHDHVDEAGEWHEEDSKQGQEQAALECASHQGRPYPDCYQCEAGKESNNAADCWCLLLVTTGVNLMPVLNTRMTGSLRRVLRLVGSSICSINIRSACQTSASRRCGDGGDVATLDGPSHRMSRPA